MSKWKPIIILLALILAALACSGGTSGSTSGSRQSCQSSGDAGTCEGGYAKLSGTTTQKIELDFYKKGDPVLVEGTFSVGSGGLKVSIEAPDGTLTTAEAQPGAPAMLSGVGTVQSSFDELSLSLTLEALDETAEDIVYSISFRQP